MPHQQTPPERTLPSTAARKILAAERKEAAAARLRARRMNSNDGGTEYQARLSAERGSKRRRERRAGTTGRREGRSAHGCRSDRHAPRSPCRGHRWRARAERPAATRRRWPSISGATVLRCSLSSPTSMRRSIVS